MAWPGIKALLAALESSVGQFGLLKSVFCLVDEYISIYESASKGRKDYTELRDKLNALLNDLATHVNQPMGLEMTQSVNMLCRGIELELKSVEEHMAQSRMRQLAGAMDVSSEIYECYRRIQGHMERLTLNANMALLRDVDKLKTESLLASMLPAKSAAYNSNASDEIKRRACAPGTRISQIELLLEWARNPDTGSTCWINGMAGTGKTTIAYTVCGKLEETFELGASFFCTRTIPECRQVKHIIPSLAYQLARFSLPFQCALVKALESDPDAHTREMKIQYQKLLIGPLMLVREALPTDCIVVIDALDECESADSVGQILDLLASTPTSVPIRFLVSSRPEPEIYRRMGEAVKQSDTRLVLHDLEAEGVKSDIEVYMGQELQEVPLTNEQRNSLAEQCGVLFICASTTCRYIQHAYNMDTVDDAVKTIIGSAAPRPEPGERNTIDELYLAILTAAYERPGLSRAEKASMKTVLETVVCALEPMSLDALVCLLGLKNVKQLNALLQPFRSVLNVKNSSGLVTTLHASFQDFILSFTRSAEFHCDQANRNTEIGKACLRMIDRIELKFNICGLSSSYLLDDEIEDLDDRVGRAISPGLVYACQYWSAHLSLGEYQDGMVDPVQRFFSSRLLIWMEVLNLTKRSRYGTSIIQDAEKWCMKHAVDDNIANLAHDAWQFVSTFANHLISRSTPHIYVSMLPFWPASRPISKTYMPKTVNMIQVKGSAIDRRRLALLATWQVDSPRKYPMSLCADGTRLAVTTEDGVVVFDAITGESILSLTETDRVFSVAISSDGTEVIFVSGSGTIKQWDGRNGGQVTELLTRQQFGSNVASATISSSLTRVAIGLWSGDIYIYSLQGKEHVLGPLKGHSSYVTSVSFPPNGSYLASGCFDGTVRAWDATHGRTVGNALEGHADVVRSVSFSPDGSRLASASDDRTIRVWDPETGQTVLGPIEGHSNWVFSVAFSRNNRFIASGSADCTIRVYDAQTGQTVLGPLQGHAGVVYSVIFSSDSTRLFSSSSDNTIRAWNVQDMNASEAPLPSPSISSPITTVQYSHSGSRIVSGSGDGTIHIWDVQTGLMVLGPLCGHTVTNDAYIASASDDRTLRIWDASNGNDIHGPIQGHKDWVICVRFSPDGSVVASGSYDGTVRIWDVASGKPLRQLLEVEKGCIESIGFSPNGQQLTSGSVYGTLHLLDLATGAAVISPLPAHRGGITSVEFSPDGSRILSSSQDGDIHTWDAQPGQQTPVRRELSLNHDSTVYPASFSPDGRFIVSGCGDGTVRVWDAHTGRLVLGPLEGHHDTVLGVQFSPDGSHVVSCSDDRTIRFWDMSSCTVNIQRNIDQDGDTTDGLSQSIDNTPESWSLNEDGWVVDQEKRRLVWVPSDLRTCLQRPLNEVLISDEGSYKLEVKGALIGERWTGCYRP